MLTFTEGDSFVNLIKPSNAKRKSGTNFVLRLPHHDERG